MRCLREGAVVVGEKVMKIGAKVGWKVGTRVGVLVGTWVGATVIVIGHKQNYLFTMRFKQGGITR